VRPQPTHPVPGWRLSLESCSVIEKGSSTFVRFLLRRSRPRSPKRRRPIGRSNVMAGDYGRSRGDSSSFAVCCEQWTPNYILQRTVVLIKSSWRGDGAKRDARLLTTETGFKKNLGEQNCGAPF